MRTGRRFISLLLAALLTASLLPASALAQEAAAEAASDAPAQTQTQTQTQTEAQTEAQTETQTQTQTEVQTETEAQTTVQAPESAGDGTDDLAETLPDIITMTYVNPLYADVIRPQDVPAPASMPLDGASGVVCDSVAQAGAQMRQAMTERADTIVVRYRAVGFDPYTEGRALMLAVAQQALAHTGVPDEGDYLSRQYGSWSAGMSYAGAVVTMTYTVKYYTTAAQETAMDTAVTAVLDELALENRSDYMKLRLVYDYVTKNVAYDYGNLNDADYLRKHTAYAALVDGKAVCQGYAALLYRLLLEVGVDCRVITGTTRTDADEIVGHDWNIAAVDGLYYDLDSTWDAHSDSWHWFLRCDANFSNHTRLEEFTTAAFLAAYPMGTTDCPAPAHDYAVVITPPTHLTDGYTTFTCADCGDSYVRDVVKAEGHTVVTDEAVPPACTQTGLTQGSHCSVCGAVLLAQQIVAAVGHSYSAAVTKPTVSADGYTVFTCAVCGDSYRVDGPAAPGKSASGWLLFDAGWYYFSQPGVMQTGWRRAGSVWYYLDAQSGRMLSGQWLNDVYYFKESGVMAVGWAQIDGCWYYFSAGGVKRTGWLQSGGSWYYLGTDGRMRDGEWYTDANGKTYYLRPGGKMAAGWAQIDGCWYYFSAGGVEKTGWLQSGGSWYCLGTDGRMRDGEWYTDANGKTYYLRPGGKMAAGWEKIDGCWYYFSAGGLMKTASWLRSGSYWYWLKADGKMAKSETVTVGGRDWAFDDAGHWLD